MGLLCCSRLDALPRHCVLRFSIYSCLHRVVCLHLHLSAYRPTALQLLRRFPEPKPLRAEAPTVTLLGGASIPSAREALTASAAQRTFIACFSATETRPECAQLGLAGSGGSAASASASGTNTVAVGERVTVTVQLRDTTGAPFAQSGWKWRVELTSDTFNAGSAKSVGVGSVAATPAGLSSSSSAAVAIRFGLRVFGGRIHAILSQKVFSGLMPPFSSIALPLPRCTTQ